MALGDQHLSELHARAQELGVPGFRMLSREELIEAIEGAEAEGAPAEGDRDGGAEGRTLPSATRPSPPGGVPAAAGAGAGGADPGPPSGTTASAMAMASGVGIAAPTRPLTGSGPSPRTAPRSRPRRFRACSTGCRRATASCAWRV